MSGSTRSTAASSPGPPLRPHRPACSASHHPAPPDSRQARAGGRLRHGPAHRAHGQGRGAGDRRRYLAEVGRRHQRRRLALKGICRRRSRTRRREPRCPQGEFDFIWSWGVIHHSSRTGRVLRNLYNALKPGGEELRFFMVYEPRWHAGVRRDRQPLSARLLGAAGRLDELLRRSTDGYLCPLLHQGLPLQPPSAAPSSTTSSCRCLGLEADAVLLLSGAAAGWCCPLRSPTATSPARRAGIAARSLFATATKPWTDRTSMSKPDRTCGA